MPCLLKIKVFRARNLPSMDRKSLLADPYVEIRFSDAEALRTNICKKTLNPVWNEDFRLEVGDDSSLQDEPLELRVVDYDSITYDDLIGSVFFDLNVLLIQIFEPKTFSNNLNDPSLPSFKKKISEKVEHNSKIDSSLQNELISSASHSENKLTCSTNIFENTQASVETDGERSISGWFPIFDTQNGIRGELQCQIKLEFFGDVNPFRESSAGIRIFSMEKLPFSDNTQIKLCGFISAIVTVNDPEYHWSDNFRTQRTSNESRQRLFYQISGELRRKMGKNAIKANANVIVGYKHSFDFEEKNKTLTARAVGTAIFLKDRPIYTPTVKMSKKTLNKQFDHNQNSNYQSLFVKKSNQIDDQLKPSQPSSNFLKLKKNSLDNNNHPISQNVSPLAEKLLYSDSISTNDSEYFISKIPNQDTTSFDYSVSDAPNFEKRKSNSNFSFTQSMKIGYKSNCYTDCDILTIKSFPPSVIYRLGGAVMAHSVKVIEDDEEKTRQSWWDELRKEIKNHAKSLGCTHVIGYSETCAVYGDVVVLSVSGTAAILDIKLMELGISNINYTFRSATRIKHKTFEYNVDISDQELSDKGLAMNKITSNSKMPSNVDKQLLKIDKNKHGGAIDKSLSDNEKKLNENSIDKLNIKYKLTTPKAAKNKSDNYNHSSANISQKNLKNYKPHQCRMFHASHNRHSIPYPMRYYRCGYCKKTAVPEIILSTTEIPQELDIIEGEATIVEAHICRPRGRNSVAAVGVSSEKTNNLLSLSLGKLGINRSGGDAAGGTSTGGSSENYAAFISDILPFIQYDLHRQLLYKLSVYGMNAIFGLCYHLSFGDQMVIATAIGTAVYATALPTPGTLVISRNIGVWDEEDRGFLKLQDRITSLSNKNRNRLDKKFRKKIKNLTLKNKRKSTIKKHQFGHYLDSAQEGSEDKNFTSDKKNKLGRLNLNNTSSSAQRNANNLEFSDQSEEIGTHFLPDKIKRINNSQVHSNVAIQIDDDADEDLMAALFDHPLSQSFTILNTDGEFFVNKSATNKKHKNNFLSRRHTPPFKKIFKKKYYANIGSSKSDLPYTSDSPSSSRNFLLNNNKNRFTKINSLIKGRKKVGYNQNIRSVYNNIIENNQVYNLDKGKKIYKPDELSKKSFSHIQSIIVAKRIKIDFKSKHPNRLLANLFNHTYQEICSNLHYYNTCYILGLNYSISNVDESLGEVELLLTATAIGNCEFPQTGLIPRNIDIRINKEIYSTSASSIGSDEISNHISNFSDHDLKNDVNFENKSAQKLKKDIESFSDKDKTSNYNIYEEEKLGSGVSGASNNSINNNLQKSISNLSLALKETATNEDSNVEVLFTDNFPQAENATNTLYQDQEFSQLDSIHSQANVLELNENDLNKLPSLSDLEINNLTSTNSVNLLSDSIELTKLSFIPGHNISTIMGRLALHFVKEVSIESSTKGPVGMSEFVLSFINDVNACIKSHVEALRGNAFICMSIDNQQFTNSKSTAYAIFSISGDVVFVEPI
ncbi:hypothetical protein BB561_001631 [Smittium simulii]|uniref:C2 domain-containing protein n=1 Tax=Smittium simulii TaxID=133385 RepID=A0A2T9YTT9_9FUNG|nr:hypothetical protein BB561_001631 [Smittium simulii]